MDSSRAMPSSFPHLAPILIGVAVASAAIVLLALMVIPSNGQPEVDAQRPDATAIIAPQVNDRNDESDADGHLIIRINEPLDLSSSQTPTPILAAAVIKKSSTATKTVSVDLSSTPRVIRTATPVHTSTPVDSVPTSVPPTLVLPTQGPFPSATEVPISTPTAVAPVNPTRTPRPEPTATQVVPTRTPVPIAPVVDPPTPTPTPFVESPTPIPTPMLPSPTPSQTVAASTPTVVATDTPLPPTATATEATGPSPTPETTATKRPRRTPTATPDPDGSSTPGSDATETAEPTITFGSPDAVTS
jgi:hypothetical protein